MPHSSSSSDDPQLTLIAGLRDDQEWAAAEVVRLYGDSLRRIADHRLQSGLKRRVDADDILQSAFRTFFRRTRDGQLSVDDTTRLWNMLCAITLTKVREKTRFHGQEKRGIHREDDAQRISGDGDGHAVPARSVYQEVDFADEFRHVIDLLDEEEHRIVMLKLDARTHREVAEEMQISERTVRRMLKRVQTRLESMLD